MTAKWNGKKYSLEVFCSHHRNKHSQLVEAAQNVQFQVPDEHTRVGYLLDNIEHQDADLRASIAQIRTNSQGTRNDFEKSVSILLPVDPFAKNTANKPKVSFEISSAQGTKFGRGSKTNVDLRWHKRDEFANLSSEAKDELREWQNTSEGKGILKASRDAYFKDKPGTAQKRRNPSKKGDPAKKKLKLQVTALQKKVDETSQLTEIVAMMKENNNTGTVSTATVDERSISMARKVMKIVGRNKKTDSS